MRIAYAESTEYVFDLILFNSYQYYYHDALLAENYVNKLRNTIDITLKNELLHGSRRVDIGDVCYPALYIVGFWVVFLKNYLNNASYCTSGTKNQNKPKKE